MGCRKTFTLEQGQLGDFPLHDAAYAANVDKIFGTSGPYLVVFNATTGEPENWVKIASPMYGYCRICYHAATGKIFVSSHYQLNELEYRTKPATYKCREIWCVDPSTMEMTRVDYMNITDFGCLFGSGPGPECLVSYGTYIHFLCQGQDYGEQTHNRFDATNFNSYGTGAKWVHENKVVEQIAMDATYIYLPDPWYEVVWADRQTNLTNWSYTDMTGHRPTGCVVATADSKLYLVSGDDVLIRVDDFYGDLHTHLDLSSVTSLPVGVTPDPCRIKCLSDGLLYLPCMNGQGVIVWNCVSSTGVWHGGYSTPVDIIETGSKKWVVQNASTGLMEFS